MAETEGDSSNSPAELSLLFETLAEWQDQLQHLEDFDTSNPVDSSEEPQP